MRKNILKAKTTAGALAFMTSCLLLGTANVNATSTTFTSSTKNTSNIAIQELDYDLQKSYEAIELDFLYNISLKENATVTVKDNSGNSYKSYINEVDHDDLSLDVTGLKAGKTYTVKIKGIKNYNSSKYGTLKVKFSIPKGSVAVKQVEYDADDSEVTFDFNKNVSYNNAKVVITNTSGTKTYSTRIVERDSDELSVRVNGLKYGSSYKYTITGVSSYGSSSAPTLSGTFTAVDYD